MKLKQKIGILILTLLAGQTYAFANEIICRDGVSKEVVMQYRSANPIPDYNTEAFVINSSYGAVSIKGNDYGMTWVSVKNKGNEISYEIKLENFESRPIAFIHLSLDKSGVLNGYQQYNDPVSDKLVMELLNCSFADLN